MEGRKCQARLKHHQQRMQGMCNTRLVFVVIVLLGLAGSNLAWGELGHMIVAKIAQNKLVDAGLDSDAFYWAQSILQSTKTDNLETNWPFLETAGWADRQRNIDRSSAPWHFVAKPIIGADFTGPLPIPSAEPNITIKLVHMFDILSKTEGTRTLGLAAQGDALRFAIHLMGDIHQPLHDACKFTKKNPRGDAGANLVPVIFEGKTNNLHSVWDSLFNKVPSVRAPLTDYAQKLLAKSAQEITNLVCVKAEAETLMASDNYGSLRTYENIAQESYQLAIDYAHAGVQDGITLSDAYISRSYGVVQTRLVQAGLRLAYFVSSAYRSSLASKRTQIK